MRKLFIFSIFTYLLVVICISQNSFIASAVQQGSQQNPYPVYQGWQGAGYYYFPAHSNYQTGYITNVCQLNAINLNLTGSNLGAPYDQNQIAQCSGQQDSQSSNTQNQNAGSSTSTSTTSSSTSNAKPLSGTISISALSSTITQGQSETLSISFTGISGGTPNYTWGWYQIDPNTSTWTLLSGKDTNISITTSSSTAVGTHQFQFRVYDSSGQELDSNIISVQITAASSQQSFSPSSPYTSHTITQSQTNPVLPLTGTITISTSQPAVQQGQTDTLSVTFSGLNGGTPPYSWGWFYETPGQNSFSLGSGSDKSITISPTTSNAIGTYSYQFRVWDSLGHEIDSNIISVQVTAASSQQTSSSIAAGAVAVGVTITKSSSEAKNLISILKSAAAGAKSDGNIQPLKEALGNLVRFFDDNYESLSPADRAVIEGGITYAEGIIESLA